MNYFRKFSRKAVVLGCSLLCASMLLSQKARAEAITEDEVVKAQKAWSDGVIAIATAHAEGKDFKQLAENHVDKMYAFEDGVVLFKPTLAADDQFRLTREEAISYFIGGNDKHPEDKGFAIKPWTSVRWENADILTDKDSALAMGNYFFKDKDGKETKVEYSFGYKKEDDGNLEIVLHHSSVPFSPAN